MTVKHILHIDTSGAKGKVFLTADGIILSARNSLAERAHAGTINKMIEEVILASGIAFTDLDAIALCSGPGSYTGLRIGMATAKGLCYALEKPLITHNKLELLTEKLPDKQILALLPARTGEYFMALYAGNHRAIPPKHALYYEVEMIIKSEEPMIVVGKLEENLVEITSEKHAFILIEEIDDLLWAREAATKLDKNDFQDLDNATPMYLKQVFFAQKQNN